MYRIGQRNAVLIKYLCAKGTSDDHMWPLVKTKLNILSKAGLTKENLSDASTVDNSNHNKITQFFSKLIEEETTETPAPPPPSAIDTEAASNIKEPVSPFKFDTNQPPTKPLVKVESNQVETSESKQDNKVVAVDDDDDDDDDDDLVALDLFTLEKQVSSKRLDENIAPTKTATATATKPTTKSTTAAAEEPKARVSRKTNTSTASAAVPLRAKADTTVSSKPNALRISTSSNDSPQPNPSKKLKSAPKKAIVKPAIVLADDSDDDDVNDLLAQFV